MPPDSSCIPVLCHSGTCSTGITIPPPIPLECNTHQNGNIGRALCYIFIPPDSTGFWQEWVGQCEDLQTTTVDLAKDMDSTTPTSLIDNFPFKAHLNSNYVPTDPEIQEIKAFLLHPIERIRSIEQELIDLETRLKALQKERKNLIRQVGI